MSNIAIELALITEHKGGIATIALNDELLHEQSNRARMALVKVLTTLTKAQLFEDLSRCPADKTLPISVDRNHAEIVMQLKLLRVPTGEFLLLTYFGGEADPSVRLADGLKHAIEVVDIIEKQGV